MPTQNPAIAVLTSGGLDSAILVSHLAEQGKAVQPIYVNSGLHWQPAELTGLKDYLTAMGDSKILPLVELALPLDDIYTGHWSLTGQQTPDATTPDEAVYLPGRNLLLTIKPAIWCQLHGIKKLALGVLGSNPFDDASDAFFAALESTLAQLGQPPLEILRPFGKLHKREVMELGRNFPLQFSFSCIAPVGNLHCGRCNKCAERKAAFASIDLPDATVYAN